VLQADTSRGELPLVMVVIVRHFPSANFTLGYIYISIVVYCSYRNIHITCNNIHISTAAARGDGHIMI